MWVARTFSAFQQLDQNSSISAQLHTRASLCFIFNRVARYPTPGNPSCLRRTPFTVNRLCRSGWRSKNILSSDGRFGTGVGTSGYPAGDSEYSSLQTKVQKRLTGHFTTLATFTWSKLITDDGNPPLGFVGSHNGSVQDWRNLSYEHAISPQTQVLVHRAGILRPTHWQGSGSHLHGVANAVAGGWTVNTILYLSTGVPIHAPGSGNPLTPSISGPI